MRAVVIPSTIGVAMRFITSETVPCSYWIYQLISRANLVINQINPVLAGLLLRVTTGYKHAALF